MVFSCRKQVFFGLGVTVVGVFLMQMQVGAQIPERESEVIPERDRMEEQASEQSAKEATLRLTGYVDATYLYNFGPGDSANPLNFPADNAPRGDFNLSALWVRLEKDLVRGNSPEAGFVCGVMIGEDATYYASADTNISPPGPDSSAIYVGEAMAKIWLPELQMEMWVGKFQSVIGYETIWRPDNPCITFGIADVFMPQDNTGVLAIFSPDDLFDIGVGVGGCSGQSNDLGASGNGDEYALMSYAKISSPKKNAFVQPGFYATPSGSHGANARISLDQNLYYNWNLLGEWSPLFANDKWKLAFNTTGGSGTGDPSENIQESPTTFVTGALYSMWSLSDPVTLNGRVEYVHTNNNALTGTSRLSGGDYYDYTLTLGVKITENLVWRGEGRFAWGAELMNPTASGLWTAATEIYYRF
jgi:hypothetical protein